MAKVAVWLQPTGKGWIGWVASRQRRLMAGRGWSLRQFNDWLLSFGTIPQGWIEKYGLD